MATIDKFNINGTNYDLRDNSKVLLDQGIEHVGNALVVGEDGLITTGEAGIPDAVKVSLLELVRHVAYTDDQGQTYYDALYAALYADRYPKIVATYAPGGHIVYQGDTLESLESYLTVRYYNNAQSSGTVVTNYTLSGTLTEGTQTIYVSYNGCVTSFSVEVLNPFLYRMETPKAFNGSAGVDTGLQLLSENRSYTIAFDLVDNRNYTVDSTNSILFRCHDNNGRIYTAMYDGGQPSSGNRKVRHVFAAQPDPRASIINDVVLPISDLVGRRVKGVLAWDSQASQFMCKIASNGTIITPTAYTNSWTYVQVNGTMTVGGMQEDGAWKSCFYGTMNDFKVFDYAMTEAEAVAYLEEV